MCCGNNCAEVLYELEEFWRHLPSKLCDNSAETCSISVQDCTYQLENCAFVGIT